MSSAESLEEEEDNIFNFVEEPMDEQEVPAFGGTDNLNIFGVARQNNASV